MFSDSNHVIFLCFGRFTTPASFMYRFQSSVRYFQATIGDNLLPGRLNVHFSRIYFHLAALSMIFP